MTESNAEPCPYCGCPGDRFDGHCCEDYEITEAMIDRGLAEARRLADADDLEPERLGDESPERFSIRKILGAAFMPQVRAEEMTQAAARRLEPMLVPLNVAEEAEERARIAWELSQAAVRAALGVAHG